MRGHAAKLRREVHHHAFAHHQTLLQEEVLLHVLRIDDQILKDVLRLRESAAKEVAGARDAFPLGEEAAPVALSFTHHRLDDRRGDRADVAAEGENVFADSGVALMRHRGGTDLTHEERFFEFQDFGTLLSQHFVNNAADGACADRQRADKFGLIVTLDVPGDRGAAETEDLKHALLGFKALLRLRGERADGTSHFTDEDTRSHLFKAGDVAAEFVSPDSGLVAEGDRHSVDNVRTAGHRGGAILLRESETGLQAGLHVAENDLVGVAFKEDHAGVDNVLARGAPVNEFTGMIRKNRLESAEQRHDRDRGLVEFADRRDVKELSLRVLIDHVSLILRNNAELTLSLSKSGFRVEPLLGPGLVAPNLAHFVRAEHRTVDLAINCGRRHFFVLCLTKFGGEKLILSADPLPGYLDEDIVPLCLVSSPEIRYLN